ncbi:hypothetical protein WDW86_15730 [Bdellovibrionota bacterium FG-2]
MIREIESIEQFHAIKPGTVALVINNHVNSEIIEAVYSREQNRVCLFSSYLLHVGSVLSWLGVGMPTLSSMIILCGRKNIDHSSLELLEQRTLEYFTLRERLKGNWICERHDSSLQKLAARCAVISELNNRIDNVLVNHMGSIARLDGGKSKVLEGLEAIATRHQTVVVAFESISASIQEF